MTCEKEAAPEGAALQEPGQELWHRILGEGELLSRGISPCGELYIGIDWHTYACARPLHHNGNHFSRPDTYAPPQRGLVVFDAVQWGALGRALAASESAWQRDIENTRDDRADYEEWPEEAWERADAAIADAAARGEL